MFDIILLLGLVCVDGIESRQYTEVSNIPEDLDHVHFLFYALYTLFVQSEELVLFIIPTTLGLTHAKHFHTLAQFQFDDTIVSGQFLFLKTQILLQVVFLLTLL